MGEIVIRNGSIVISDEIHCEILYKGYRHTPFAAISEEIRSKQRRLHGAQQKPLTLPGCMLPASLSPTKKLRK